MEKLTSELRQKFVDFHAVYEWNLHKLKEVVTAGNASSATAWQAARFAVPLTQDELHLYRMYVDLHSVSGGELFADPDNTE